MKITEIVYFDGALEKVTRLGMSGVFLELQQIMLETKIYLEEKKDANGAAIIRKAVDERFEGYADWTKKASGGVDWIKKMRYNHTILVRMGVELQVSARSDLLIRDIVHLRNSIDNGEIEVGVIVVPSNVLQVYLPDRTPSFRDAMRYMTEEFKEAQNYPLIVMAIEHDGPGAPLGKQKRKA